MTTPYTNSPNIAPLAPEIETIVAAADRASVAFAATEPKARARALVAVADALDANADELVALAGAETGLTEARLRGELNRTAVQLRLFADVVVEGAYLDVRIDRHDDDFAIGVRPELRMMRRAVGPVVVFAASNFPFAFSVAGGDTASALAAGCPVLLKTHSGHPRLSERTGELVAAALRDAGMPDGVFATFSGQANGTAVLQDPRIQAGSFTGSEHVGRLLADLAAARPQPIRFYGELGSTNPVFVTRAAIAERPDDLVAGLVGAVAGSAGQLCTKPGFVFVPEGHGLDERIAAQVAASNEQLGRQRLLNPGITRGYTGRRDEVLAAPGVRTIVAGEATVDDEGHGWTTPTIVAVSLADLRANRDAVLAEVFGPFTVLVEVPEGTNPVDLVPEFFSGALTATLQTGADEASDELRALTDALTLVAGRVLYGGWPTGVAVTHAMTHGGPWPATTNDSSTSVGTAAIDRFLRPVTYQSMPEALLPEPVRDSNPWGVPQRISEAGESRSWGASGR
ncbi:aldehyde dehydrogenase (NADP(+)) [Gulosibacter faecalis]|jgi:NADP-dependent aldehyde dehydrogenase|uniref:Aldehyde dehydrogenase (NADP(+)) n=1 Tax=Gulosibacter faecalis TaxID=272240 RepID=A0ABW5UZP5_9MICO|nr:aldehyde dehydrogenase (NADP(+)) [Gulosibacter faecalis]